MSFFIKFENNLHIRSNEYKRYFSIVKDDKLYRTIELSKELFDEMLLFTSNDWFDFLNQKHNCYIFIKNVI